MKKRYLPELTQPELEKVIEANTKIREEITDRIISDVIDILTAYGVHYGNAYVITTTADAEKLRADKDRKTEELDKFWKARHKAMQTATA